MNKGLEQTGDPHIDDLSLAFTNSRSTLEWTIAREILYEHRGGIRMAHLAGLNGDHFSAHDDARIVFLACEMMVDYPKDVVVRIATKGLAAENAYVSETLPALAETPQVPNDLMRLCWIGRAAGIIIRQDAIERDARSHYRQCCNLLKKGAAA